MTTINVRDLGAQGVLFQGIGPYAQLGWSGANAGDVNGDGTEDFIVSNLYTSAGHAPGGAFVIYGKASGFASFDLNAITPADGFFIRGTGLDRIAAEEVSGAGDVNGDGYDDLLVSAPRNDAGNYYGGRVYLIFGGPSHGEINLAALTPEQGVTFTGTIRDGWAGSAVSAAGDVNNDGLADFLIGNVGDQTFVVYGKETGLESLNLGALTPDQGFVVQGAPGSYLGAVAAGAGDFNGDGIDDIILCRLGAGGGAWVVYGKEGGLSSVAAADLTAADAIRIEGGGAAYFEVSGAGDVNGDGYDDIVLGSGGAGSSYVIFGRAAGATEINLTTLTAADGFRITSDVGISSVAMGGDVNADGFDDVVLGTISAYVNGTGSGAAYVLYGKAGGFASVNLSALSDEDGFVLAGSAAQDNFGRSVALADLNGDGFDDVVASGSGTSANGFASGTSYVVLSALPTEAVVRTGSAAGQAISGGTAADILDGLGGDDRLFGNGGDDHLAGGDGNDLLDGGHGADAMAGGIGNDVYIVDDLGDRVVEVAGEGEADEVRTGLSTYVLPDHVEILTVEGGSGPRDLRGNAADNILTASASADFLRLQDGGDDTGYGLVGDDVFYFGGAFGAGDTVDGGEGNDQVALQGDYSAGLTLAADTLVRVETIALLSGLDTRFGDTAGNLYDYVLTTHDANVAAGGQLTIDAAQLAAGEDFRFDGRAETDGSFYIYAGKGNDDLKGGAQGDVFLFRSDGRFTADDRVDGGAGTDQLALRGNYSGANAIVMQAGTMANIEVLAILSGNNTWFGPNAGNFSYDITMHDANVASGATLIVDAAQLREGESLVFDGRAETEGAFRVFGGLGADVLTGGAGNDILSGRGGDDVLAGGLGNDRLTGGAGADVFRFDTALDGAANVDAIADFSVADDTISLSRAIFSAIGSDGTLAAGAFREGTMAEDSDDRILYDSATGRIFYDADGGGGEAAILFATVTGGTELTHLDFSAYTPVV